MKIACFSLWDNTWIPYWKRFFNDRGHEVSFLVGSQCSYEAAKPYIDWSDAVLCMWAVGWAHYLTKFDIGKPLFVIHRSFEVFDDTKVHLRLENVGWEFVNQLFMLNENHFTMFNKKVKNVQPIFIKNGIDVDFWKIKDYSKKAKSHQIAWVANLNHKKGEQLVMHAIRELQKIDSQAQMEHLGNPDSVRINKYLEYIAPYLKAVWFSQGSVKDHNFVRNFYKDKRYIINSSLAEGHPMNIIEAMAMGCQPLIHRYPGSHLQFPDKWLWADFDDLKRIYQEEYKPEEYRQYIIDNYDYRNCYIPIAEAIENTQ